MTPDERLREAVGTYLDAVQRRYDAASIETENRVMIERSRLRQAYLAAIDRPCINAAMEVERKPWWRFW